MIHETSQTADRKPAGVLGQFETADELLHACEQARDAGIKRMDAYTPFPVHGIERAMGVPRTILPFFVLAVGLGACALGLGLQWYTNGTEQLGPLWSGYQFKISGKPYFSLPANIPVAFEVIVLSSAFAAFLGMLILNRLPMLANPLHRIPRFKRATNDRFFLMLEAGDESFDLSAAREKLAGWGATEIEDVWLDNTDHKLPAFLQTLGMLALVLLMVPPVLVYRARGMTSRETRLHVNPDMDFQVRYDPQSLGPIDNDDDPTQYLFEHQRAAFAAVPGTVARGPIDEDVEYLRGIEAEWFDQQTRVAAPAVLVSGRRQEKGRQEEGKQEEKTSEQEESQQEPGSELTGTAEAEEEAPPEPDWIQEFPSQVDVSETTLLRGQRMFNIYCSVCHGYSGDGNGLVNQRAMALTINGNAGWTTAKSLYDAETMNPEKNPVGRIYDTITNGRATMGPYATRIQPADRWAIVLYVKSLHETRRDAPHPDPNAVTQGETEN